MSKYRKESGGKEEYDNVSMLWASNEINRHRERIVYFSRKIMKKQEKQEKHEVDEFEDYCHLWNLIPGGTGKGIVLLRKTVDAMQNSHYSESYSKPPSFLIVGSTGKTLASRALVNSFALEDIRVCPGRYFENGIYSYQFFFDSIANTAHIIADIEDIKGPAQATLWKILNDRECKYFNRANRSYDLILHCNGLVVLTGKDRDSISDSILDATDVVVEIEPLNLDMLLAVVHQRLVFCGLEYEGEQVLQAIVDQGQAEIDKIIDFLKVCVSILKAELGEDILTVEMVERAKTLINTPVPPPPIPDDIPF